MLTINEVEDLIEECDKALGELRNRRSPIPVVNASIDGWAESYAKRRNSLEKMLDMKLRKPA